MRSTHVTAPIFVTLLGVATPAAAVDITACGQSFDGTATLVADLDCTGLPGTAVRGKGSLDLAGFVLTAGDSAAFNCTAGRCTIFSSVAGGEIVGSASAPTICVSSRPGKGLEIVDVGIRRCSRAVFSERPTFRNVTITDSDVGLYSFKSSLSGSTRAEVIDSTILATSIGIEADQTRLELVGSTITGASFAGVYMPYRSSATVEDSDVSGNQLGLATRNCKLTDSNFDSNVDRGVDCGNRLTMNGGSASGNGGAGVRAGFHVRIRDADVSGNGGIGVSGTRNGQAGARANISGSTMSNNGLDGVYAMRLKIKDSVVTGNGRYGARAAGGDPDVRFVGPGKLIVNRSTISGNGEFGLMSDGNRNGDAECVYKSATNVKDTTVTANGTAAGCGSTVACGDIASCTLPKLGGTAACDTSYQVDSGIPGLDWDVCALD